MAAKRNDLPYSRRIVLALLISMMGMGVRAADSASPTLLLNVVIEGLDADYIDLLKAQLTDEGFKRLISDGVTVSHAGYGTTLDAVAAQALLMTGAAPAVNGIGSAEVYDREAMRVVPALLDPQSMGNYTQETYSPRALAVGTLADEVRIAGGGLTAVYSVAADPRQAIALAGHAANAALWIDSEKGNWASSTFYTDIPPMMALRNRQRPLDLRLDTVSWTPLLPTDSYPGLPEHLRRYPFRYVFAKGNPQRYDIFKASARANTEVADMAGELIADRALGTHEGLDMLSVAYSLAPFDYTRTTDTRLELMDKYVRLDRDLARLFEAARQQAGGADRVAIVVSGTPRAPRTRRDDSRWTMPGGEFSSRKALSLLNMYLIASFGNGEWFNAYYDGQFYLNRRLVHDRQADAAALRQAAADFLSRMSGVHRVYTLDDVTLGRAGDERRRSIPRQQMADVMVDVMPGWEIIDDFNAAPAADAPHFTERYAPAWAPVYILAPGLKAQRIDTPVDARSIAPTVAGVLRIRSPNAAESPRIF